MDRDGGFCRKLFVCFIQKLGDVLTVLERQDSVRIFYMLESKILLGNFEKRKRAPLEGHEHL